MAREYGWRIKALTPIWTGDADQRSDRRLILTGLVGSIRWWFEVLVRGLGGWACDPTGPERCPARDVKSPTRNGHHCVVCELFGCTGWARKFRFMVLDDSGAIIEKQIQANQRFVLRFAPLRHVQPEEWCLLDLILRLIAEYGAVGGKTVFKPSDEPGRGTRLYHQGFGLVQYLAGPEGWTCQKSHQELEDYLRAGKWRRKDVHQYTDDKGQRQDFSWASLENFWCVKGMYLARQDANTSTFNRVVGRKEPKSQAQNLRQDTPANLWLAGSQQESKKVSSFKHPIEGGRTFGFVKPGTIDFDEIQRRLATVWPNFDAGRFKKGAEILDELFSLGKGTP